MLVFLSDKNEDLRGINISETRKEDAEANSNQLWWIELRDSYTSGLYLFGFLKVAKGKPLEKIFWAFITLLILSITFYMVYQNATRYAAYGVRTDIKSEERQVRALPVITLCLYSTFTENVYCYNNASL